MHLRKKNDDIQNKNYPLVEKLKDVGSNTFNYSIWNNPKYYR